MSLVLGACATNKWDTSAIDDPRATLPKVYTLDEAGVTQSMIDHLSSVSANQNEWAPSSDEAACVAERVVGRLGATRLLEMGYDPQVGAIDLEYDDDQRIAVVNIIDACVDLQLGLYATFSSYSKLEIETSDCLSRGMERRGVTRAMATAIVDGVEMDPFDNDEAVAAEMAQLTVECVGQDELAPDGDLAFMPRYFEQTTTTTVPDAVDPGSEVDGGIAPANNDPLPGEDGAQPEDENS